MSHTINRIDRVGDFKSEEARRILEENNLVIEDLMYYNMGQEMRKAWKERDTGKLTDLKKKIDVTKALLFEAAIDFELSEVDRFIIRVFYVPFADVLRPHVEGHRRKYQLIERKASPDFYRNQAIMYLTEVRNHKGSSRYIS